MGTAIGKDVPAFVTVFGSPAEARSMNFEGMRRRGFSDEVLHALRRAYKVVYRQGLTVEEALKELAEPAGKFPEVALFRSRSSIPPAASPADHGPICVALVAGEASGDILGSGLMRALKAQHPMSSSSVSAVRLMEAEGLTSYFPWSAWRSWAWWKCWGACASCSSAASC
jgi:hypothetical protein